MIRYEIRERSPVQGEKWSVVAWFDSLEKAREYWSDLISGVGVEGALVKIEYTETYEHYHSADGKIAY